MSLSNFHFLALFETPAHDGVDFGLVAKPVKIEFFKGGRSFKVFGQFTNVFAAPKSGDQILFGSVEIKTDPKRLYIAIQTRVQADTSQPDEVLKKADELIDTTIAKMASVHGDELFINQVYRGAVEHAGDGVTLSFKGKVAATTVQLRSEEVQTALEEINGYIAKSEVSQKRLRLAARFYAKSLLTHSEEERFLLTWTVLEVFPMTGTSDIAPLKQWLSDRTGNPLAEIERKLQIGRLYGYRCSLVHDGFLPSGPIQHEILHKVYVLATEAIHHLCGRPYTGATGLGKLLDGA